MGEIADMMLDGTLCEGCGTYMGDSTGFPGYCSPQCARDRGADYAATDRYEPRVPRFSRHRIKPNAPKAGQVACPDCSKVVKEKGLRDHQRDVHGKGS